MQHEPTPGFRADRLQEAARGHGLTQQAVAFELGMSISAVQKWFLGKSTPQGVPLIKLAQLLGVDPEWLFGIDLDRAPAA